jgi:hypothetical protein
MLVAACGQRALRVPQVRKGSPGAHTAYHNVHLPRLSPALLSHCATPQPPHAVGTKLHTLTLLFRSLETPTACRAPSLLAPQWAWLRPGGSLALFICRPSCPKQFDGEVIGS